MLNVASFKSKKMVGLVLGCLLFVLLSVNMAEARPYAYLYGYKTIDQGEREWEFYTDYQTKNSTYSLKNQLEFEYGITDHWMVSLYGVFAGSNTSDYKYNETKLATRYRFGEKGMYLVDSTIYLEYKMPVVGESVMEIKEILSKDFGEVNLTLNFTVEKALSAATWDKGYTVGVSRMFTDKVRFGLEAKGSVAGASSTLYIGPSVRTKWNGFGLNLVAGIGANDVSNSLYIRSIISRHF